MAETTEQRIQYLQNKLQKLHTYVENAKHHKEEAPADNKDLQDAYDYALRRLGWLILEVQEEIALLTKA